MSIVALIALIVLLVLLWFVWVVPQRRRQRRQVEDLLHLIELLQPGDEIVTAGGIHGTVREAGSEDVKLEISPGVVVTLDRRAIAAVAQDELVDEGEVEEDEVDAPEEEGHAEESLKG